jgi:hypothetical protein
VRVLGRGLSCATRPRCTPHATPRHAHRSNRRTTVMPGVDLAQRRPQGRREEESALGAWRAREAGPTGSSRSIPPPIRLLQTGRPPIRCGSRRYGECGKFPQALPAVRSELRPSVIVARFGTGSSWVGGYMTDDARSTHRSHTRGAAEPSCGGATGTRVLARSRAGRPIRGRASERRHTRQRSAMPIADRHQAMSTSTRRRVDACRPRSRP